MSHIKLKKICSVILRILCILLSFLIGFFFLFELKARDLVHNLVGNELEIHAMNAIDKAVYDVLSCGPIEYESIIISDTNSQGQVNAIYTDSAAINLLKTKMSLQITENIRKTDNAQVGVPMGAFTGLVLLSNIGPDIYVSLTFDGSVSTNIKSQLISAGINQTMHRVYMVVKANVSLTCPIINYETEFTTEYELCQTVIVGNTPELYASRN